MKRIVFALTALTALTACGTDKKADATLKAEHSYNSSIFFDPSWVKVGTGQGTGGSFGGSFNLSYSFFGVQADQVAVAYPASCGMSGVTAKVVAPGQTVVPTHYSAEDNKNGWRVVYFAVNGNGSAGLTGVVTTISLSPGAACNPIDTYIHPAAFNGGSGGAPIAQLGQSCGGAWAGSPAPVCAAGLACRNEASDASFPGTCQWP